MSRWNKWLTLTCTIACACSSREDPAHRVDAVPSSSATDTSGQGPSLAGQVPSASPPGSDPGSTSSGTADSSASSATQEPTSLPTSPNVPPGITPPSSTPIASETSAPSVSGIGGEGSVGGAQTGVDVGGSLATGGVANGGGLGVGGTSGASTGTAGIGPGLEGPWPPSSTFQNPVLWNDLADDEVIRVGDTYYYTASNMHYSPGAPILRSFDLVNWEYAGHALPVLDFSAKYDLDGGHAYIKGTWASTLQYRASNETFYWLGCIEFSRTYVYTAEAVEGPWEKHPAIDNCYYDAGMLIDEDDTIYVAYGNTELSVAELSDDGLTQVRAEPVYTSTEMTLEGARFYKRDGYYYIFVTRPADGQFILRADNPWGPYELHTLIDRNGSPVSGGGVPHQGGLIETQTGDWYYMAFVDSYPGGRIPVLAPVAWTEDGWPAVELVDDAWGVSYPYPDVPRPPREVKAHTGTWTFVGPSLGPEWEWNHNPDNDKWSFEGGLRLQTATVTDDLYEARNTLTHRILGPESTGTIELDLSEMQDGDVAGLALLRHFSAHVAVKKSNGELRVVMTNGLAMDGSWNTTSTGSEAASASISEDKIWLRLTADIRPGPGRLGQFSYSTDGTSFQAIGPGYAMNNSWEFFMGYRFGIFNFATMALGGAVTVDSFTLAVP